MQDSEINNSEHASLTDKEGGRYSVEVQEYTSETGALHTRLRAVDLSGSEAGDVHFYLKDTSQGKAGSIEHIGVNKDFQRKGIASELLRQAESRLQSSGAGQVVAALSDESVGLFINQGYENMLGPQFTEMKMPGMYSKQLRVPATTS